MRDEPSEEKTNGFAGHSSAGAGFQPAPARPGPGSDPWGAAAGADWSSMPGLCRHCESRDFCTLSTREQPVWHCEHYQ